METNSNPDLRDDESGTAEPTQQGRLIRKAGLLVWEPAPGTRLVPQEEINEAIRLLRDDPDRFFNEVREP